MMKLSSKTKVLALGFSLILSSGWCQTPFGDGPSNVKVKETPSASQESQPPAGTPGIQQTTATTVSGASDNKTEADLQAEAALNAWKGGRLSPEKFFQMLGPVCREIYKKTGVPASVTLAQASLETGFGSASIGSAKKLFGIKGTGPGGSVLARTSEFIKGKMIQIKAKFRKYNSWKECVEDHAKLLLTKHYAKCMKYKDNPNQFAKELKKAGYATDPKYDKKLIGLMKKYNLYLWDK